MINIEQIRAARAMLNLNQKSLAEKAGISVATLNNLERGAQTDPRVGTLAAIQQALEALGMEFINRPEGSGVLLKKRLRSLQEAVVLIVDDCVADRELYRIWLQEAEGKNYAIIEASDAQSGLDAFITHQPDCVILDFMMYGTNGFQLLASLKQESSKLPPIIFVTGMEDELLEDDAKKQGITAYMHKGSITREQLCDVVHCVLGNAGGSAAVKGVVCQEAG